MKPMPDNVIVKDFRVRFRSFEQSKRIFRHSEIEVYSNSLSSLNVLRMLK